MKAFLFALLLALTSCLLPPEDCQDDSGVAVLHASTDFDNIEQAHLQNAAVRWNAFANHEVIQVRPNSTELTCTVLQRQPPPPAIGLFKGATGNILIAPLYTCVGPFGNDMACFEAIVMHEMGHLLGLSHLPNGEEGIMRAESGALDFSDADHVICVNKGICVGAAK